MRRSSSEPSDTQSPHVPRRVALWTAVAVALAAVWGGAAQAQSSVSVEVRAPGGTSAEGSVTLTPDGATTPSHRCNTRAGVCTVTGVPGGRYVVRLTPTDGSEPPEPRVVVIPPSGSVTLRVSTH